MVAIDAMRAFGPTPTTLGERVSAWLPALVLAYTLLAWPLLFVTDGGGSDLASPVPQSNLANQLYFPLVFLCALAVMLSVPLARLAPLRHATIVLMGVFLLWAAASLLWAVEPGITLRRLIQQACLLGALVPAVLAARDVDRVIDRLFIVIATAAIVNVLFVLATPPGPIGHEGIYSQKNMLGSAAAILLFAAIHQVFAGRGWMRALAVNVCIAALALLIVSRSKTSLGLALVMPVLAFLILVVTRLLRLSPAVIVVGGLIIVAMVYYLGQAFHVWDFALVAGTLFGDPTLTSRTDIWAFAAGMIEQRPLLGFGYESFWGVGYEGPSYSPAIGFIADMPHAHNGYLDLLLQTGVPGLLIGVGMLLAALHASVGPRIPVALSWMILTNLLFMIGHNFLETTWFQGYSFNWIMFVIMITLAARLSYRDA